jgi:hypothetical protein
MATMMSARPPSQAPEDERREEEVRAPAQEVPVSGRLHVLQGEHVLVLPTGVRIAASIMQFVFFSVFAFLWLTFGAFLILDQSALDTIWQHLLDLPLLLQVFIWILLLPLTVGLWIWESDWDLWLRLMLVIFAGVGWTAAMFPRPSGTRELMSDATPGWHELPHEPNQ